MQNQQIVLANGKKLVLQVPKSAIFPGSWVETLLSVSVAGPLHLIPALTAALQFLERGQHLGLMPWT